MRIFSGIRPSGNLHLGNYLGAVKNWIELQNKPDTELAVFGVMDYHGITTPYDPKTYRNQVLSVATEYISAGLNPDGKKILLIRQSRVPQHTELAWLFNTITPISWLNRLPTYKEQLEKSPKYNHIGLFDYPVLMAADILAYKAGTVPVGADQMAHIDITNEIAKKFNSMFGETFSSVKVPKIEGARIMSLQNPNNKMSKTTSAGSGQAGDEAIMLLDTPDEVRNKIKKAVTDSGSEIKFDIKEKPAISNLLSIFSLVVNKEIPELEKQYSNKSYSEFKNDLAEVVVSFLKPFQEKYKEINSNPNEVEETLIKSEENAINIVSSTLKEVKEKMGL
ncbi:MAG: tryptophan--tRNA ligase [Candidatus Yanofskybacteria bacterium CG10_big_fil_rev_8_21_14_0_10_36_16]|uniref:Tryptophan--tRNA ligase n=1 Tax=Candidatus Yanofskybacteria bacterium CG10_big_fil_rev_8_21_14_0_10_36_16 TaxID=1975096 RepID=A0A2J0Q7N7_9BACT|nr:MAG: tryptophan--tRNA ligase [Candidatus Yanofskybacteria bacterium CG10_big_fil_rev_8_21_14_0_10_36_16]